MQGPRQVGSAELAQGCQPAQPLLQLHLHRQGLCCRQAAGLPPRLLLLLLLLLLWLV